MKELTSAIILAAGKGTRLKSHTQDRPKALMPIAGVPAISHVIRQLVAQGIHNIAINTHHHAEQLQHYLGSGEKFNANLAFSYEAELLNSGGGVRTALELLPHRRFIAVYNADILSDINLQPLLSLCPENGCALALVPNPKHNQKGDFALRQHQVSIGQDYTFSGVSLWAEEVLRSYPVNTAFPLTQPIQELISKQRCAGILHHNHWFDIGRPRDLIQANHFFQHEGL